MTWLWLGACSCRCSRVLRLVLVLQGERRCCPRYVADLVHAGSCLACLVASCGTAGALLGRALHAAGCGYAWYRCYPGSSWGVNKGAICSSIWWWCPAVGHPAPTPHTPHVTPGVALWCQVRGITKAVLACCMVAEPVVCTRARGVLQAVCIGCGKRPLATCGGLGCVQSCLLKAGGGVGVVLLLAVAS